MATSANQSARVEVVTEDGFDTMKFHDMGDCISIAQVSEHGDLHDVQLGRDQARKLVELLTGALA